MLPISCGESGCCGPRTQSLLRNIVSMTVDLCFLFSDSHEDVQVAVFLAGFGAVTFHGPSCTVSYSSLTEQSYVPA